MPEPAPLCYPGLGPHSLLRITRHTADLEAAERFWVEGLGLSLLQRVSPEHDDEHERVLLGWKGASWHLELVADADAAASQPPSRDLLVLATGSPIGEDVIARLEAAGGTRVQHANPREETTTIQDPDGYFLVLSPRTR